MAGKPLNSHEILYARLLTFILILENMIIAMDVEIVRNLLKDRLPTAELANEAAERIGVSVATMYRYKKDPQSIPFGKLVTLGKYLGFPIGGSAAWSRSDVLASERRRYELEAGVAAIHGTRYIVTPSFTVTCELPEFTEQLWDFDYGTRQRDVMTKYMDLRKQRCELYKRGAYESVEIFIGAGYEDFLHRRGRFRGVSEELRNKQLEQITRSLEYPHVHRRVYLKNTPELPIFSCYSTDIAVIRVDDFTVEFNGPDTAKELIEIFNEYYDGADLKTAEEVREFLLGATTSKNGAIK